MADALPFHPAYGLPDEVRLEILAYADKHSVADAALVYRVSQSAIYNWRNAVTTKQVTAYCVTCGHFIEGYRSDGSQVCSPGCLLND